MIPKVQINYERPILTCFTEEKVYTGMGTFYYWKLNSLEPFNYEIDDYVTLKVGAKHYPAEITGISIVKGTAGDNHIMHLRGK